ncbi:MAG: bile acid:sodium symporter [Clostridiales bacterium]|nr:bile acid:sodium symporter [Clostridiales bacterium]
MKGYHTILQKFLKNNSFIILILLTLVFSILLPQIGQYIGGLGIVSYLTFIAMFASGLGISTDNIKDGVKDYKSILFSFFSVYLIFPVIAFLLFKAFPISSGDIFIGGMILAAQSSTLASAIILTMSANGNVPLALIITIINNIASAVITPLVLKATLSLDQAVDLDVGAMIVKLLLVLVLPVILAQIIRRFYKKQVEKVNPYRKMVSKFVVLIIVLTGSAAASSEILNNMGLTALVILIVAILHIIMLLIALLYTKIAKVKKDSKTAVLFCSTQKTLPASMLIWSSYFPQYVVAPIVMVLYHVTQLIIDSFIVGRINNKNRKQEANQ